MITVHPLLRTHGIGIMIAEGVAASGYTAGQRKHGGVTYRKLVYFDTLSLHFTFFSVR